MLQTESLGQRLRSLPRESKFRFTSDARQQLTRTLFYSLAGDREQYLNLFFPQGPPPHNHDWKLSEAWGAVDGAEYTEAARGKRCGHIFKHEEATYFCRTCTTDATCVLCQKCFEASDHEGHTVEVYLSEGSSGCCDCGDDEAWNRPLKCGIHTPLDQVQDQSTADLRSQQSPLPRELLESIRFTVSRALDYMCDVFSCAPEHMRAPKHAHTVLRDADLSRLVADWYGPPDGSELCNEYALILWNDEKHTVDEVREQVARACQMRKSYGENKAREIDAVGRAVIQYSPDIDDLIRKARILEQIKVTVTIRSSRDYFREQMCDTVVEWLSDISACSVGADHNILMDTVCSEMLKQWQVGSHASNLQIGRQGLTDHERSDNRLQLMRERALQRRLAAARDQVVQAGLDVRLVVGNANRTVQDTIQVTRAPETDDENDDDADEDGEVTRDEAMRLIEALAQDPDTGQIDTGGIVLEPPQNAIVTDTGELLATAPAPPGPISPGSESADADDPMLSPQNDVDEVLSCVGPSRTNLETDAAPSYWLRPGQKIALHHDSQTLAIEENFNKRVRIDFLILYDLRMWKILRNNLRKLYIGTVVKVPQFKRVLGLRFAAIYRVLAQLYLVADREPDHSIINLSLQMLTTPSITAEIIQRGNFCTRLLAILYTFLTKRRVGDPEDVDLSVGMNFEAGVITNRRIHHFLNDLRYMLEAKYTQQRLREDPEYLLQFLDILKLFQGMDSNVRAVGEHVPFETDAWMTTIILVRDVARNIRAFAEAFRWDKTKDDMTIMAMCRAIKEISRTAILHSLGIEHARFHASESRHPLRFKTVAPYEFERQASNSNTQQQHSIVDFAVEREALSFHHPLHWALSWIIDEGKSMSKAQLQSQMNFSSQTLQNRYFQANPDLTIPELTSLEYMLALFDIPLRTLAWISQLKAGMWVRNGLGLRHQMVTYRQVTQREITSQRDIFLLQAGMVVCPPQTLLANIIDRFHMDKLIRANYEIPADWEDHHLMDVAEDFVHLLIVLVSDRTILRPIEEDPNPASSQAVREIVHTLCFKPLPYSDLTDRITHSSTSTPEFNEILFSVARFKPPEGFSDSGVFALKEDCYDEIDPYYYYYSKNQREEAENAWRRNEATRTGKPFDDVVFEPHMKPIKTGLFTNLSAFTQTPLFGQVIWGILHLALNPSALGKVPPNRVEAFLPLVLHLIMIASIEDDSATLELKPTSSFNDLVLHTENNAMIPEATESAPTILHQLFKLRDMPNQHEASKPRIRRVLQRLRDSRTSTFDKIVQQLDLVFDGTQADSLREASAREQAEKKRKAMERNARVMASFKKQQSDFMSNQVSEFDLEGWDYLGDDVEMCDAGVKPLWGFPRDTCIFCQEETDDQRLYGSLAYINKSKVFRATDLKNWHHLQEVGMTPLAYNRDTEKLRPFGLARSNVERVKRVNESGAAVMHERRGLGKGWQPSHNVTGNVSTSCGHLMHYDCFETFSAATTRRQSFQIARNHPERLPLKEFVCPLCKALGNTFLPIIFKPKELLEPGDLVGETFDGWLLSRAPFLASESRANSDEIYVQESIAYRNLALQPIYASSLIPDTSTAPSRVHLAMPAFLGGSTNATTTPASLLGQQSPQNLEVQAAYKRLKETILANGLDPWHAGRIRTSSEYSPADVLSGALGSSIAAAEIAARGQESASDSTVYLDRISQQTITHLRILSETCSTSAAYIAMGGHHATRNSALTQRTQLFGFAFDTSQAPGLDKVLNISPLLSEDVFEFVTRCSIFLNPYMSLAGQQHIMRLGLLAEIVKVVIAHLENFDNVSAYVHEDIQRRTDRLGAEAEQIKSKCSPHQSQAFSAFTQTIIDKLGNPLEMLNTEVEFLGDIEVNPNM